MVLGGVIVVGHFLQTELERCKTVFQRKLLVVSFDQMQSVNNEIELVTCFVAELVLFIFRVETVGCVAVYLQCGTAILSSHPSVLKLYKQNNASNISNGGKYRQK